MSPEGFEPTIPASERPQRYALDRAAAGVGTGINDAARNILKYTTRAMKHPYVASVAIQQIVTAINTH
jgi:hypothetical protein